MLITMTRKVHCATRQLIERSNGRVGKFVFNSTSIRAALRGSTVLTTTLFFLAHNPIYAGARSLAPEPLEGPQFSPPSINIAVTPPSATEKKVRRQAGFDKTSLSTSSREPALPFAGRGACPAETTLISGSDNPASDRAASVTSALERLRATASGTVLAENRQLSKERFQQLHANAAWQLGLLTLHGICLTVNTADAALWFERAQKLGEPLAAAGLAWCEIEGCKAAANPAAANKWIELLRRVDAPRAMYLQWLMQSRLAPLAPLEVSPPELVSKNPTTLLRDRQLLAAAAQLGDTNARIEMGLDRVNTNQLEEALAFFKSAALLSVAAATNLAVIIERQKTGTRSPPPINRAGGIAPVRAQTAIENFAQAQSYHRGTGVPSNYTEAIRLYQLATNQGNVPAQKMLALIFSRPGPDGLIDLAWMQQLAQVELGSTSPIVDKNNGKQNLKREPTPLFELVRQPWRRLTAESINA